MKSRWPTLLAVLLAGCTAGPPPTVLPDMTFANMQPIRVNAAQVVVVDAYKSPLKPPDVEYLFATPPDVAAQKLLKRQLVAAGSADELRAVIEEASVVRTDLPAHSSLTGFLMQAPAVELKAVMKVRFELVDPAAPDIVLGHAEVIAHREKTIDEGLSPDGRARAWFDLTEELMDNLDTGMQSIVKKTFGVKD
ncbi:MAG: hypothetical protein KGL10_04080 [Alphaproteobacteria bacterium]|nr:hypothetical protein [Alphaproteobacteria bacterium]MDE2336466.1 hypothetical protein [Alphaproteobacteria bacterium]